ncbi:hypothetical protein [Dinghuibacter silviterrae]|uniref:Uncharacterized protein n=1 Tax=Dinghuibacter silviterrae TaxID=1539049 RepID=A0A4R8DT20_9BACT|nr:hypothetical protein [Dinghuibacter silviterrae]TDX01038.1 hypothetical protein EDB95_2069 [Dinghuibacter silviterrae]
MNRFRTFIIGWAICSSILPGCSKDINEFTPSVVVDTAWVQQITSANAVAKLSDTLQLSPASQTVQLPSTDTLSIDGMTCPLSGLTWTGTTAYTGAAQVQGLLVEKPGEWIRQFLSATYQGKPIQTGAALFLSVTGGGNTLEPNGYLTIFIPVQDSVDVDGIWSGGYTPPFLQWAAPVSGASVTDTATGLKLTTPATGWLLCGRPFSGDTSASVTAILPNSFSNANSAVFCLLPAQHLLVGLKGQPSTRTFTVSGLPAGAAAILVSLSYAGNSTYYLGTASFNLGSGTSTEFMTPSLQTLSSLISYLEQL